MLNIFALFMWILDKYIFTENSNVEKRVTMFGEMISNVRVYGRLWTCHQLIKIREFYRG
jgi:hypothetical protein